MNRPYIYGSFTAAPQNPSPESFFDHDPIKKQYIKNVMDHLRDLELGGHFNHGDQLHYGTHYKISCRTSFRENGIASFYKQLTDFANNLNQDDIPLLVDKFNPKRMQLDALFSELVDNGFNRASPNSSLAFWSGEWAKYKAKELGFTIDVNIPVYTAMLGIINHGLDEKTGKLMKDALFTHYASEAKGNIAVFTSRPNQLKSDVWNSTPFMVAHNYFWDVELPALFTNHRNKNVPSNFNAVTNAYISYVVTNPTTGALELKPRISLMNKDESDHLYVVNRSTLEKNGDIQPYQMMRIGKLRQIASRWKSLIKTNQADSSTQPT